MNDKTRARREANYQRIAITIQRWQAKLAKADAAVQRSIRTLAKLERKRRRMEKALAEPPLIAAREPTKEQVLIIKSLDVAAELKPAPPDDLSIPTFLQRKKLDPVAAAIKLEQEEQKLAKSRGRIEKMKAKQRGDLSKMPLTGKAALDAIRNA